MQDQPGSLRQALGELARQTAVQADLWRQAGIRRVPARSAAAPKVDGLMPASPTVAVAARSLSTHEDMQPPLENAPVAVRAPRLNRNQRIAVLQEQALQAEQCRKCPIGKTRDKLVYGCGNPEARIVFVGEAPGNDEDKQGEPFVGRAGKLLNKMIAFMGLKREDVYIMNTLKCHPPENRNPSIQEMDNCRPFFEKQLDVIQPSVIVALGAFAAQRLLNTDVTIGRLRGVFHEYRGIPVMPTYHPAFLLRNPTEDMRNRVKSDLQQVVKRFLKD